MGEGKAEREGESREGRGSGRERVGGLGKGEVESKWREVHNCPNPE